MKDPIKIPERLLDDAEAFERHVDRLLSCQLLRKEECVKEEFVNQSVETRLMWGDDESQWPESHQWETFRQQNMWLCEQRAREIDPDKSKWVHYPEFEGEWK